jgi:hypothetical protein
MKTITSPEQAQQNKQQFRELIEKAGITQLEASVLVSQYTNRPCSVRTIRAWLSDSSIKTHRPCPNWAVDALKTALKRTNKL